MSEPHNITKLLSEIEHGSESSADHLLRLIYDQLRAIAANQLAGEVHNRTLQTTALVHEAYLRLFGNNQKWSSRRHFFSAASLAMRRILIEQSRRRLAAKRGGGATQQDFDESDFRTTMPDESVLELHEALEDFAKVDVDAAQLVQLRFFAGLSMSEAAETLEISERSAYDLWSYARAWLKDKLGPE
ncbi:MAG: ECF-type sigma factor [Pirellulales bacterium]